MRSSSTSAGLSRGLAFGALLVAVVLLARSRGAWRGYARGLETQLDRAVAAGAQGARAELALGEVEGRLARAEHAAFLVHLAAAREALEAHRLGRARRELAAVPEEHLGWEWSHLDLRLQLATREVEAGDSTVTALAVDPAGEWLASGTREGRVRVWSTADTTSEATRLELELEDEVRALALEGERLVVVTWGGRLAAFDLEDGVSIFDEVMADTPTCAAWIEGGGLVVGYEGGAVAVRDSRGSWSQLAGHEEDVGGLAVSRGGGWIASAGDDGLVLLHGGPSHSESRALRFHQDWVRALAFDEAGERLASGGDDGLVALWDVVRAQRLEVLEPRLGGLRHLAFLGHGLSFLTDEGRGRITRGHDASEFELDVEAWEETACVAYERRGESYVAAARGESLLLWSYSPRPAFAKLELADSALRAVAQSSDGAWIAAGSLAGEVVLLDGESGVEVRRWTLESGVLSSSFSIDGTALAAGSREGELCVWDVEDGSERARWTEPRPIASLALSDDGGQALCVSWDGGAGRIDLEALALLGRAEPPRALVLSAAAAPGAELYGWVGDGGAVRVWDAVSGARRAAVRDRELGRVEALAFSPDAALLGAIASGSEVTLFDLEVQGVRARARELDQGLSVLAFDPSGERFLTGGLRGRVTIRDAWSAEALLSLESDGEAVSSASFSPDGSRVLVGNSQGALIVWETDADALEALRGP